MNCPVCSVELLLAERQGFEIDYCPKCRGIWLDRGELDKVIERAATSSAPAHYDHTKRDHQPQYEHHDHDEHEYRDRKWDDDYRSRKRESILGELFDF